MPDHLGQHRIELDQWNCTERRTGMGIAVTAVDWESRRESDALTRTLHSPSLSVPVLGELYY